MAANPLYAVVLLGLGITDLSMNPHSIPMIKETIRGVEAAEARVLVDRALTMETAVEVEVFLRDALRERIPQPRKAGVQ
jgi:phosphotransferase system enzyme I (PtsI)